MRLNIEHSSSIEQWCRAYIVTTSMSEKLSPPPPPDMFETTIPERVPSPGRPAVLTVVDRSPKRPRSSRTEQQRARLLHGFFHHELQAAELMCWAVLAFADEPEPFRRGLLKIALDEIRHCNIYKVQIERLGFELGFYPVRDWFWERVPLCKTALQYVACMGIGFEGGNLDHSERFAAAFREHGDEEGAAAQDLIGREEIAHVRFAVHWFKRFWSNDDVSNISMDEPGQDEIAQPEFEAWCRALPAPLSPLLMRGKPIQTQRRRAAGLSDAFINALIAWKPS